MYIDFGIAGLRRESINPAAKNLQEGKIDSTTSTHGNGRFWTITANNAIGNENEVGKGEWPIIGG